MSEKMDNKNNSGYSNSGDRNSGDRNSGYSNSGYSNSGDRNSGDRNSGDRNSGDSNSGYRNSGYRNSGYWNSGDRNSGYWNSGDSNSGYWNSGYRNSGYCNTNEPKIRIFNKETNIKIKDINFPDYWYFDLTEWVEVSEMTDEEKEEYYWYKTNDEFLRNLDYKESWKKSFEKAEVEDVKKTLELPNFDYKIFQEISGISKDMLDKKLGVHECNDKYKFCPECGTKLKGE